MPVLEGKRMTIMLSPKKPGQGKKKEGGKPATATDNVAPATQDEPQQPSNDQ